MDFNENVVWQGNIARMICNKNLCHYDVAPKATVIIVDCKDVTAAKISKCF